MDYCDKETEIDILQQKVQLNFEEAQEVVRLVSNLRSYGKGFSPSIRASLMIATIAKKADISINPENKRYQVLCLDVLTRAVNQTFPDLNHNEIQELIYRNSEGRSVMSTKWSRFLCYSCESKVMEKFSENKIEVEFSHCGFTRNEK